MCVAFDDFLYLSLQATRKGWNPKQTLHDL